MTKQYTNEEIKEETVGWSVSNAGSGDNLEHGFESEKEAYAWLDANIPSDEHELVIVEPEEVR